MSEILRIFVRGLKFWGEGLLVGIVVMLMVAFALGLIGVWLWLPWWGAALVYLPFVLLVVFLSGIRDDDSTRGWT